MTDPEPGAECTVSRRQVTTPMMHPAVEASMQPVVLPVAGIVSG